MSVIRSHLLRPMTRARPSRATRSASVRSCFSSGAVASISRITTSANFAARSASALASFSSLSSTRARRRRPAVSNIFSLRPRHSRSSPIASRVRPASGPTSKPLLAEDVVEQGGLAGVRPADDGDRQRLGEIELGAVLLVVEGLFLDGPRPPRARRCARAASRAARNRARRGPRRARPRTARDRRGRDRSPPSRRRRRRGPRPCWRAGSAACRLF